MSLIILYILAGLGTLAASAASGPLGRWLGIIDYPDGLRKEHPAPVPLTGGLAVVFPFLCVLAYLALVEADYQLYGTLVVGGACFVVLGYVDDRHHLRPTSRLFLSVIICVAIMNIQPDMVIENLHFTVGSGSLSFPSWDLVFTIIVLVGFVYAFNMTDGINGLAIGIALVWVILLSFYAPPEVVPLLIVLGTGLLIALAFNMAGRQFLGDSGTYALSIVIALLSIYVYNRSGQTLPADVIVVWFIIPVVDCLRLMLTRSLDGCSPLSPDRNHLHHQLCRLMSARWVLVCYLLLIALPGVLTAWLPGLTLLWLGMTLAAYGSMLALARRRHYLRQGS